jgi:hypothetical protein
VFLGNTATVEGGALHIADNGSFRADRCTFEQNTARRGGALTQTSGNGNRIVTNCTFRDNSATGVSSPWDYHGGGAVLIYGGQLTLVNCEIQGNTATAAHGGAALVDGTYGSSTISMINCTVANNTAPATNTGGVFAGQFTEVTTANIVNSILWNNQGSQIASDPKAVITVSHSDVQGGHAGPNNIDDDPMFVSATDLRLSHGSRCINAGLASAIPPSVTADLAGNPRVQGSAVDMGAYEFEACWGDVFPPAGNGIVGIDDLLTVINGWGTMGQPWGHAGDTNGDGLVNVDDILIIVNYWGPC